LKGYVIHKEIHLGEASPDGKPETKIIEAIIGNCISKGS
jgi:hypothetical protein